MTALATPVRTPVPHRLSSTLLGLVLPVALLAGSALVALSWRHELPDPVATHWGTDGPDGFSSFGGALAPLLLGLVLCVGAWAMAFWAGRDGAMRRIAVATSAGLGTLFALILLGTLSAQRGLADAAQAPGVGGTIVGALLGALAVGIAAALLVPRDAPLPTSARVDPDAPRVPLSATQRAAWSRTVTAPAAVVSAVVAITASVVLVVALGAWPVLVVPVILAALLAVTLVWRVTVDDKGLQARSLVGWPTVRVPLDEVERAAVVDVRPLREFGGWGYRLGRGGRSALALRAGQAVEVHRTGGRVLVVTVDDAATAAALLNTLADRARA
ncbi:hypothetical protein CWIS_02250 [Cellulomonas sp. A375-1]|uniref:DUF1648 domain-containing protein n=1 Tax=Cellulomonas sp. A375-1 TaxID=1672219 RepID=UPI0006527329|nr:DUF1648 domain-containing protein [Cellulomonas sp. A375-1]KMM46993.1 hypothetical protein CWIS_02250 [Cellulomonas sp. A375-1]